MRDRSILLLLSAFVLCAFSCGADHAPPMVDPLGGTGGGTQSGFCGTYCGTIVANGTGCQSYDAGGHCGLVCGWYQSRPACVAEYSAFASCIQGASTISCQVVATTGKLALNVPSACSTQFNTFQNCINVNNVGFCPYGS
jgi:hypothetical protein